MDLTLGVDSDWEGVDNALGNAVWLAGWDWDGHGGPVAIRGAPDPIPDAGKGGVSSASSGGGATGLDDSTTPGGDLRDELALEVVLRQEVGDLLDAVLGLDFGESAVRNLGVGVVTPNDAPVDITWENASLLSDLTDSPVVVEPGHSTEVLWAEVLGVVEADSAVSVGWVADDDDLDGLLGVVGEGLTLDLEDATVLLKEVSPVHAVLPREGADKEADISVLECNLWLVSWDDLDKVREGAVGKLHDNTVQSTKGWGDFEEVEPDLPVTKEITVRNAEREDVADLTGGASDDDIDGFAHAKK